MYVTIHEMACTLKDVMARRIGLELTDWEQTLEVMSVIVNLMQEALWFSAADRDRMLVEYRKEIQAFREKVSL